MVQQLVLHGILHPMLRSCLLLDLLTVVDVYFHSPFAFEDVQSCAYLQEVVTPSP